MERQSSGESFLSVAALDPKIVLEWPSPHLPLKDSGGAFLSTFGVTRELQSTEKAKQERAKCGIIPDGAV